MSVREVVESAQGIFGQDTPPVTNARPRRPPWVPERLPEGRSEEPGAPSPATIPIAPDDELVIRGLPANVPIPKDYVAGESGTDVLAYYLPFHFYKKDWGIYLRASGIAYLAQLLRGSLLQPGEERFLRNARRVLFEHEFFHFHTEWAASVAEAVLGCARYADYFADAKVAPVEEAVANASAVRSVLRSPHRTLEHRLADWMSHQGAGYRDFASYVAQRAFRHGRQKLAEGMVAHYGMLMFNTRSMAVRAPGFGVVYKLYEVDLGRQPRASVPTYLAFDQPFPWLQPVRPFPALGGVQVKVYTRDHAPPHFHIFMPPHNEVTKFAWPSLAPVEGKQDLGVSQRKRLCGYLKAYGSDIHQKLCTVYGASLPPARCRGVETCPGHGSQA